MVERALLTLADRCDHVLVGGLSMGAAWPCASPRPTATRSAVWYW